MKQRLVHQLPPTKGNPRNSEGAFLRGKRGEILFAYSYYQGTEHDDDAACNIALIESWDEGESWSEPRFIARAWEDFSVRNIMSVSSLVLDNGDLAFYFLIKENDHASTLGRAVSSDGIEFVVDRCVCDVPRAYYVVNNDRIVRLSDGRIVAPAAYISLEGVWTEPREAYKSTCLISEDGGYTFTRADYSFASPKEGDNSGFQEPGIIEYADRVMMFIRTGLGSQYVSDSFNACRSFAVPQPSDFTSPLSPMQIRKFGDVYYAVHNPYASGHNYESSSWGRTPLVVHRSLDGGKTYGKLNFIEDDPARGYCYPALFATNDGGLLVAYCRGNGEDGCCLCRLGIMKIDISTIED